MSDTPIKEIMESITDKIGATANADTVIGERIDLGNGVTVIPVSKVSYGFGSGGSDLPSKQQQKLFGGAAGSGVTVQPIAFLVVKGDKVSVMSVTQSMNTVDKAIEMAPEMFDRVTSLFNKKKNKSEEENKE